MASRQLRRLAGDGALPAPGDEVDEDDVAPVKAAKPSAFALLDAEEDGPSGSSGAASAQQKKRKKKNAKKAAEGSATSDGAAPAPPAAAKPAAAAAAKSPAPEKEKKGETAKVSAGRKGAKKAEADDEDIDALVAQIDGKAPAASRATPSAASSSVSRLFAVDGRYLSVTFELRQNFGATAVRKPAARTVRKCWFVRPQESWPRVCGINMEHVASDDGLNHWRFQWSAAYESVQETFEQMVATNDPQYLQQLVREHPFHIDACLQLSELAKATGEYETAAQLIERCIYAYETAMPAQFDPAAGNNRINFGETANRGFFLALFRQLQIAGRQSCNFTAYAISRFLLGLDPSDPLFIILIVDYYALRCKDFGFIFRLQKEFLPPAALLSLPNINFSLALARFHQERADENKDKTLEGPSSSELLLDALMRFPVVLLPLLKKAAASIAPLGADGKKVDVTAHSFFLDAHTSPSLQHLVSLYVERQYGLWKPPEVLRWLEGAVATLLALVEKKDARVAAAAAAVKAANGDENNKYHNLAMDQYTEAVATVIPANLLAAHDDLPQVRPPPRVRAPTNNPFALFLSTLMPWMPVPNAPAEGGDPMWLANALAAVGIGEREVQQALDEAEDAEAEHEHED